TERVGFLIVAGVLAFLAAIVLVYSVISPLLVLASQPDADPARGAMLALMGAVVLLGFVGLGRAFWRGQPAARWTTVLRLVLIGAGLIGLAVWVTTLDYPNAQTPAIRAEMQADDRRQLPWRFAEGLAPILVGLLLLPPPVGRFLDQRRRSLADG